MVSSASGSFAEALQEAKAENGLSISEIAERAEMHRTVVSRLLRGLNEPTQESRQKLANALYAPRLSTAGVITLKCVECGKTYVRQPHNTTQKYCSRNCNNAAASARYNEYQQKYVVARATRELEQTRDAVLKFCQWCAGAELVCPNPVQCPLAKVSPLNYT